MSSENALQKQAKQAENGLANAPLKKKIGFFSAMMVVVGSCIGAGIFFKAGGVLTNSANSVILAIFSWLLASFAVIAMGLALVEISSARNDNLSIIGWSQTFNGKIIYKSCKNFMVYIYLPLTYFFMPLYVVMSIQDGVSALTATESAGFGTSADWAIMMAIAVAMSIYFIVVCGASSRVGNIQNWIITAVKFIPLVLAVGFGFAAFAQNGSLPDGVAPGFPTTDAPTSEADIYSFATMTPGFGIFIAVAAIFFAYDGFYVAAGIQSEMKEPKKTPLAILFGLIIVTVIYLMIAIAMSLGAKGGSPFGFQGWLSEKNLNWLYATFQILIGIGVLGIINGFAMWSTRFMEDLILADEVPYSTKLASKINPRVPWIGIMYNLVLSLPIVVVFCIIGGLGYVDSVGYGSDIYGTGVGELYSFADLMGTWTALLAFAFITFAIVGAIKNRSTNFVKVQKTSYFMPMAVCAVIINGLAIFFTFFEPIANLFFLFRIPATGESYVTDVLVPRVMVVVVLFLFLGLMLAPIFIEEALDKKKYGSLDEAQMERAKVMAEIKGHSLEKEILLNLGMEKRTILKSWEQKALHRNELTARELNVIYGEFADLGDPVEEIKASSSSSSRPMSKKTKSTSSSRKTAGTKKTSSSSKKK